MKSTYKLINMESSTNYNKSLNLSKFFSLLVIELQHLFLSIVSYFNRNKVRKVVIVGQGDLCGSLLNFFDSKKAYSYQLMGIFDIEKNNPLVKGDIEDLKSYCLREEIDEIYFTRSTREQSLIADLSQFADQNFMYFRIATEANVVADKAQEVNTYYFNDVP
ncbi:MAG: hypothetical protein NW226_08740, partial [Microscillaceae bacterium]|nr:hypothetical protein [Microscillaceae bacterium]